MKHTTKEIAAMVITREKEIKEWEKDREKAIARRDDWTANWLGEKIGAMTRAIGKAKKYLTTHDKIESIRDRLDLEPATGGK